MNELDRDDAATKPEAAAEQRKPFSGLSANSGHPAADMPMLSGGSPPGLRAAIHEFFFREEVPYGAAAVRIFLPMAAMLPMLQRLPHIRELYTNDGATAQLSAGYGLGKLLPEFSPTIAVAMYVVMVFALLCGIIGWRTRLSLSIGTALYLYFNLLDCVGTLTKYSVIAAHLMLLLSVSNSGAVWSVDAILRRRREGADSEPPRFAVWPVRLMQLLFAFIYFGAAVTKIQTDVFFSGEQMRYWMLSDWNFENPLGEVMAMWSPLLLIGAWLTCIWEILFAVLVWNRRMRLVMLGIGLIFHFMTHVTLGLKIFPLICASGYLAFLAESDVIRIRRFLRQDGWVRATAARFTRLVSAGVSWAPKSLPAGTGWVATGAVLAILGVEVEYRMDVYGIRASGGGGMTLKSIPREEALSIIHSKIPLREKDKFFSFGIGSFTIGEQLANRRDTFEYGETIIAQCDLNPPHEDLWVECVLKDSEDHLIHQFGRVARREDMRCRFNYNLGNALVPGEYRIVLRSSGKDIASRPFKLIGDPGVIPTMNEYLSN